MGFNKLIRLAGLAGVLASGQGTVFMSRAIGPKNLSNALYCADTSVSANTITCSTVVPTAAYFAGETVMVFLANTVTGATTINVNSLGTVNVTKNGTTAIAANDMLANGMYQMTYDGTEFVTYVVSAAGGPCGALGGDITGTCAASVASVFPRASAASTPSLKWTGAWFTGGSSATTTPHVLIQQSGAAAGAWSTNGTALGINSASGFIGAYIDHQLNGVSQFSVVQTDSSHTSMSITGSTQGQMRAKSGACIIEFDAQGIALDNILVGTCGPLNIATGDNNRITFQINNANAWSIANTAGMEFFPANDATTDLGRSGSRVRDGWFSRNVSIAGNITNAAIAGGGTQCVQASNTGVYSGTGVGCPTANQNIRAIGATFDGGGSALTTASVVYFTIPYACTITAWNMTVDTGTATIDIWKIATGTAIPTVTNTITAAALPAISTGTALHSTTLTGWTTSVAANDIFAYKINAVSSATRISLVLQCNAS